MRQSISKSMFLAKRRPMNSFKAGARLHLDKRYDSLPGDFDALEITCSRNTTIQYIDPPRFSEKRIWIRNANDPDDPSNQHFVLSGKGNVSSSLNSLLVYPTQFLSVSWDNRNELWRVISYPFSMDGGVFTGSGVYSGTVVDDEGNPLIWQEHHAHMP